MTGKVVHTVADLPLQDQVPIEGVPTGPRSVQWVPNKPATLVWAEALDDGDPKKKVPHRDQLFTHAAPFSDKPRPAGKVEHRFAGLSFFEAGDTVLLRDYDRDRRWSRTILADLADPEAERKVVFDRSVQDRYSDPGTPVSKPLPERPAGPPHHPRRPAVPGRRRGHPEGRVPVPRPVRPEDREEGTPLPVRRQGVRRPSPPS